MSASKKRKVPTAECKAKVGLEAIRGTQTLNEISQAYGIDPTPVGLWKKEIQEQAKTLLEGQRSPKPVAAHQEAERLYREISQLKMEWEGLKKKSGISRP